MEVANQVVQVIGSLLILIPFALVQWRVLNPHSFAYLILNAVGSIVLGVIAVIEQQWGFLLLEVVWTVVALRGIITLIRPNDAP